MDFFEHEVTVFARDAESAVVAEVATKLKELRLPYKIVECSLDKPFELYHLGGIIPGELVKIFLDYATRLREQVNGTPEVTLFTEMGMQIDNPVDFPRRLDNLR